MRREHLCVGARPIIERHLLAHRQRARSAQDDRVRLVGVGDGGDRIPGLTIGLGLCEANRMQADALHPALRGDIHPTALVPALHLAPQPHAAATAKPDVGKALGQDPIHGGRVRPPAEQVATTTRLESLVATPTARLGARRLVTRPCPRPRPRPCRLAPVSPAAAVGLVGDTDASTERRRRGVGVRDRRPIGQRARRGQSGGHATSRATTATTATTAITPSPPPSSLPTAIRALPRQIGRRRLRLVGGGVDARTPLSGPHTVSGLDEDGAGRAAARVVEQVRPGHQHAPPAAGRASGVAAVGLGAPQVEAAAPHSAEGPSEAIVRGVERRAERLPRAGPLDKERAPLALRPPLQLHRTRPGQRCLQHRHLGLRPSQRAVDVGGAAERAQVGRQPGRRGVDEPHQPRRDRHVRLQLAVEQSRQRAHGALRREREPGGHAHEHIALAHVAPRGDRDATPRARIVGHLQ